MRIRIKYLPLRSRISTFLNGFLVCGLFAVVLRSREVFGVFGKDNVQKVNVTEGRSKRDVEKGISFRRVNLERLVDEKERRLRGIRWGWV